MRNLKLRPLNDEKCCKHYWLPTQPVTYGKCPSRYTIDVKWFDDGTGYVFTKGGDNADITTITQECCSSNIIGFTVSWNGKQCIAYKNTVNTQQYAAAEARPRALTNYEDTITYTCYWCPPEKYVQKICSVDEYLKILSETQVIQLAISLGAKPDTNYQTAFKILYDYFYRTDYFSKYGCILFDYKNQPIIDPACCKIRGGEIINVNGTQNCFIKDATPCLESDLESVYLWFTIENQPVSQECCVLENQYWNLINGQPIITLNINGNITTFIDTYAKKVVEKFGITNGYCSYCSNNLIGVEESGVIVIKDNIQNNLSQRCCEGYGFSWDVNNNRCTKCTTTFNYSQPMIKEGSSYTIIRDLNGNDLDEYCCSFAEGWYGDVGYGNKCYTCPGITIPDSTGTFNPNPEYTLVLQSNSVDYEILYNGSSIKEECCRLWSELDNGGAVTWNSTTNKCLTR